MSDASEERQHQTFKVGDRVGIVRGRDVGRSGHIEMILDPRNVYRYVIKIGSGQHAYCAEDEIVLEAG